MNVKRLRQVEVASQVKLVATEGELEQHIAKFFIGGYNRMFAYTADRKDVLKFGKKIFGKRDRKRVFSGTNVVTPLSSVGRETVRETAIHGLRCVKDWQTFSAPDSNERPIQTTHLRTRRLVYPPISPLHLRLLRQKANPPLPSLRASHFLESSCELGVMKMLESLTMCWNKKRNRTKFKVIHDGGL